jgi:branched-chain amino acid transport system substrate-binding protein
MKQRSRTARWLWALGALVLIAGACSSRDDEDASTGGDGGGGGGGSSDIPTENCPTDPTAEIEGDTIRLVSSYPQSGSAASLSEVAAGWEAYFEKVNAEGGVEIAGNTYQIETESQDDAYDPGQTSTNINELVGADGSDAFAAFSVIGTGGNAAVREQLNNLCVPHLHAASGSPAWGNPDFPWTVGGSNPVYTLEAQVFADLLEQENPDARVAMLVQDDDFGRAYEEGLERAIEGTDIEIVTVERYQPGVVTDVSAQMTNLTSSDADTFFDGGVGLPCLQGIQAANDANWERAITWVSSVCISRTIIDQDPEAFIDTYSFGNLKNPEDPGYDADPAMQEFKEAVGETDSGNAAFGWNEAAILVEALEQAEAPTRLALMESYRDLDLGDDVGLMGPGLGVTLSEDDRYMGERVDLVQFNYTSPDQPYFFAPPDEEIFDFEGETPELTPEDLITGGD